MKTITGKTITGKPIAGQSGISLVEVLVALVISLFLLGGIVQVYVGNKVSFAFNNALAEVQENGRFALDSMTRDLRLAGNWACIPFDPDDTSNINDTLAATVGGYDTDWHDFLNEEAISGTNGAGIAADTLTIRGGKPGQSNVEAPFTAANVRTISVDTASTIDAGDIILVARCGANDGGTNIEADILEVDAVDKVTRVIDVAADKSQPFENDASVLELQTVAYTIGNGANGGPALFRDEFDNPLELIEGVENMQVLYGIDTDDDQFPNQYVTSNNVGANFQDVVAIRLMLLVRSFDDFVVEDSQTYTFNGVQTTAGDRRIRQAFTTTIALRNRIGS